MLGAMESRFPCGVLVCRKHVGLRSVHFGVEGVSGMSGTGRMFLLETPNYCRCKWYHSPCDARMRRGEIAHLTASCNFHAEGRVLFVSFTSLRLEFGNSKGVPFRCNFQQVIPRYLVVSQNNPYVIPNVGSLVCDP